MFKLIASCIKLSIMNKLLRELCDGRDCTECPSLIRNGLGGKHCCAQCYVIDQVLDKWEPKKEEDKC